MAPRRTRLLALATAMVAVGTLVVVQPASADQTVVLDEGNHNAHNWFGTTTGGPGFPYQGSGPAVGLAEGPGTPPAGVGSYYLSTFDTDDSITVYTTRYAGLAPQDLTELTYHTYRFGDASTDPSTQVALNLTIERPGLLGPELVTTLVFEPGYTSLVNPVATDTWQEWATVGTGTGWWSTRDQSTCGQSAAISCTYEGVVATLPSGSYIRRIALKAGSGWSGFHHAAFDRIVVGTAAGSGFPDRVVFDWETAFSSTTTTAPTTTSSTTTSTTTTSTTTTSTTTTTTSTTTTSTTTTTTVPDPVPTLTVAANASFDAFDRPRDNAPYRADVFSDRTPGDPADNGSFDSWEPLAGVTVTFHLDADGRSSNGHEAFQCQAVTDSSGVARCSPPVRQVPRSTSVTRSYLASFGGASPYEPSSDTAWASLAGSTG